MSARNKQRFSMSVASLIRHTSNVMNIRTVIDLNFAAAKPSYRKLLTDAGYKQVGKPGPGGHITFRKTQSDEFLIDVEGNEWHHTHDDVVKTVGNLDDDSLSKELA